MKQIFVLTYGPLNSKAVLLYKLMSGEILFSTKMFLNSPVIWKKREKNYWRAKMGPALKEL